MPKEIMKKDEKDYDISELGDAGALAIKSEESLSESSESSEGILSENSENSEISESSEPENPAEAAEEAAEAAEAPAEQTPFVARLIEAAAKILMGTAAEGDYQDLADMVNAREAIEKAYAEGELKGRNAVIEESLVEIPAVPDLGGSPMSASKRPGNSIFDLAGLAR